MGEHAGVDVLHEETRLDIVRGVHVDRALAGDTDAGDDVGLAAVADADAVGLGAVVADIPDAADVVAGLAAELRLHAVAEFLPVARDRRALVGGVAELVTPREGVGLAVFAFAVRDDGEFADAAQVVVAADLEVVEFLARVLVGRDLAELLQFAEVVGQLERRAGHQFDFDGLVDVEDRAMLREAVLMQSRQEGQLVAGRGGIEDRLRVIARLDLMFGREEGRRKEEGEEAHVGEDLRARGPEDPRQVGTKAPHPSFPRILRPSGPLT